MATVRAVVLKHHKKKDGTWNVKLAINLHSSTTYIETHAFVDKTYLDRAGKLKQSYIERYFASRLSQYRDLITGLGTRVNYMTSSDLKDYLVRSSRETHSAIEIFSELQKEYDYCLEKGQSTKSKFVKSVLTHLKSFTNRESLTAIHINSTFVKDFESYLMKLKLSNGKPLAVNTINGYMSQFKAFYKKLRDEKNDASINHFPVPVNPFENYKKMNAEVTLKRNLSLPNIAAIMKYNPETQYEVLAKDMFIISFMMCGMNTKDMHTYLNNPIVGNSLEYRRVKVMRQRKDGAVINVLIPDQLKPLIEKYGGQIQKRHNTVHSLNTILYYGWKSISEKIGFKCTMYYARHTFANIARQVCKFSKEEVSIALNHKTGADITDVYIDPDWSVVHKVQLGVIKAVEDYIKTSDQEPS
ncbi:site-specific integrase [Sphingobacterium sp. lm-10]|uniref:site-specific integrase n=1 Tax=Sphingobacterium sp. lm-10 TaxID=2944904 RepID=UPI0020205946|nr:site-specific integrase [Sphingobacterium sp. lm-10]MCL7987769.1 site-specific integrase [Sphingobacterium sp. lm-10]